MFDSLFHVCVTSLAGLSCLSGGIRTPCCLCKKKKTSRTVLLFSYMEYWGDNFDRDMKLMANNKTVKKWWAVCTPCQIPLPDRKKGEWWAAMEEVFHHD